MKIKSLTIYCSASENLDQEFYAMAKETAEIISKYNINSSKIFTNLEDKYFKNNFAKLICIIATTADNRFNIIKRYLFFYTA